MRSASFDSLRATWKGYRQTEQVASFVRRALAELAPAALILYGSLAKGDYHEDSDADFCVVLAQPEAHFFRDRLSASICDGTGVVEPVVFGTEQFLRMIRQGATLALEVMYWGVALGGDPTYLDRLAAAWDEAQQELGLEKTPTGWRVHPVPGATSAARSSLGQGETGQSRDR